MNARLHLDIPLDGEQVTAEGDVSLRNNSLFIKPLNSTLKNLNGKFSFVNGALKSGPLTANWFNQPLNPISVRRKGQSLSGRRQPER